MFCKFKSVVVFFKILKDICIEAGEDIFVLWPLRSLSRLLYISNVAQTVVRDTSAYPVSSNVMAIPSVGVFPDCMRFTGCDT